MTAILHHRLCTQSGSREKRPAAACAAAITRG